ncbi:MAG: hypothetical protein DYH13_04530 [Alphaproteobacteria bacterium PRO2]|nr:hypothetical protein [Alphaproteobacteria bacterium PRO2]
MPGYARDFLVYVSDYHKAARNMHPSLEQCRMLFFRLKGIGDAALALVEEAKQSPSQSNNPVVNSLLMQARRFCSGDFDVVELVLKLQTAAQIYAVNPQWNEFIKNHGNAVPYSMPVSSMGTDRPESQDQRYWGDKRRAQAGVEWLLESVQKYHETRDRFNTENEGTFDPEYGLRAYTMAQNGELNRCFMEIQEIIGLLKKYAPRYERIENKNAAVEAIMRYAFQASEDKFGPSAIADEMRKAAAEYSRRGESYFNLSEVESTFPRVPVFGIYLRINYPYETVRADKLTKHCAEMKARYKDMIAGKAGYVEYNKNGFLLKVKDIESARKIAVADPLCYNFCTFKAEYLTNNIVNAALCKIEQEQKEEYVGKVVPFSRMEAGTQMHRDFIEDGQCTHIFISTQGVMFINSQYKNIIHDRSAGQVWPVSPAEVKREAAVVAAARLALQQQFMPSLT